MSSTRLLGKYLNSLTITPEGGVAVDLKNVAQSVGLSITPADTDNAMALRDWWSYPFDLALGWEFTCEVQIEPDTAGGSKIRTLVDAMLSNTPCSLVVSWSPPVGTTKYDKYSGAGLIRVDLNSPKGTATATIRIQGQGALVRTAHDA